MQPLIELIPSYCVTLVTTVSLLGRLTEHAVALPHVCHLENGRHLRRLLDFRIRCIAAIC